MVCAYCSSPTRVTNSRHQKRVNKVWRRRECSKCHAIFTTLEALDTSQALSVKYGAKLRPFSRDQLLLDVYDSLRHRKTAVSDATALTDTIMAQLRPFIERGALAREVITEIAGVTLERFDPVAATHYRAFH